MDALPRGIHHRRRGSVDGAGLGGEGKRKKKLVKVGARRMTGEVLAEDAKGFVSLGV
jgi:hypothetical protein